MLFKKTLAIARSLDPPLDLGHLPAVVDQQFAQRQMCYWNHIARRQMKRNDVITKSRRDKTLVFSHVLTAFRKLG